MQNGILTYGYNYVAESHFRITSTASIPSGHHIFSVEFTPTGPADIANGKGTPADIKLFVDGQPVGEGHLPVTIPLSLGLVDVTGTSVESLEEKMRMILARQ